ncbi:Oidioi.mRNA.OKI2018_I69.chr2.g7584.t3.cds [Oikopleura dioica]|uniref:Oidioi.mRNA.OKI2018_I69.chr2.g7584.t3.cds n=1 Tax=Oikopleura dioica TaxID=34765 RepID=A0ABN7TCJ7_OIKDI|nr:Oidioi.mRNA.OKI2018_I69.chr2.g7584.t3.cds [Oikopleura dioica]
MPPEGGVAKKMNLRDQHQGLKAGMEEWHVPICSNLPQEEVGYLKIDDVLEMWQTLGIEDGLKKTSKFFDQAEGSQTISVTNLRHSLDSVLKDVPGGQELLATYKTEITFLWEQFESAVQQAEKMKELCSAAEQRNLLIVEDAEENQTGLSNDHVQLVQKIESEWKEKFDKSREQFKSELDFLDSSFNRQVLTVILRNVHKTYLV